ncbi:unnamed protein product [Sphagnum jensenii]
MPVAPFIVMVTVQVPLVPDLKLPAAPLPRSVLFEQPEAVNLVGPIVKGLFAVAMPPATEIAPVKSCPPGVGPQVRLNVVCCPEPEDESTVTGFLGGVRQMPAFPGLIFQVATEPPGAVKTVKIAWEEQPSLRVRLSPAVFPVPPDAGVCVELVMTEYVIAATPFI